MPMALKEFAPPAAPLHVSDPQPAQNYVILEVGAKWGGAVPHHRLIGRSVNPRIRKGPAFAEPLILKLVVVSKRAINFARLSQSVQS